MAVFRRRRPQGVPALTPFAAAVFTVLILALRAALYLLSKSQVLPDSAENFWVFAAQVAVVLCLLQVWLTKSGRLWWILAAAAWLTFACFRVYLTAPATSLLTIVVVELTELAILALATTPFALLYRRATARKRQAQTDKDPNDP